MQTRRIPIVVGAVLLVGYALALFHHTVFAVGGSDSSGYLNAARLFASGHTTAPIRGVVRLELPPDFDPVFIPLGFTRSWRPGTMAPSYPPGFPLHMAGVALLGGWEKAPFYVSPIAALGCLALTYALGRALHLSRGFALAATVLLAFAPPFVFLAVQPMSDVPATFWALAAIYAADRSRSRESTPWAATAGAAFAMGVLVRPTNVVLLVPLLIALPNWRKAWVSFAAAGLPFAVFFLAYNRSAFGSASTSGYGAILAGGMAWANFPERARHYGYWIARLLSPFVPLGWMALAGDRRAPPRDRALLLTWFLGFFLFYSFYGPYEAWWYTRFLLPGLPALVLGAVVLTRDLVFESGRPRSRAAIAGAAVLFVVALAFEVNFHRRERDYKFYKGERLYPDACEMARRRLPPRSIVLSMQMSGALHYYTEITYAMWNWLMPDRFGELRASTESRGYRWYALLAPFEATEVRKNLPGDWREIDRVGDVALWELPPVPR